MMKKNIFRLINRVVRKLQFFEQQPFKNACFAAGRRAFSAYVRRETARTVREPTGFSTKSNLPSRASFPPRLWIFFHGAVFGAFIVSLFLIGPVFFNTGLFDIIPASNSAKSAVKNPAEADRILGSRTSRQIFILASANSFDNAKNGAVKLYGALSPSKSFESLNLYVDANVVTRLMDFFYQYRFVLQDENTVELLNAKQGEVIAQDALQLAYGAFNFIPLDNIETDPFLLNQRITMNYLSSSLPGSGSVSMRDAVLAAEDDGAFYVIIRGRLSSEGASMTNKKSGIKEIYDAVFEVKKSLSDVEFFYSGVPFHSYESSSNAQREISLISSITVILIVFLFLFIFRTPLPVISSLLASLLSIGIGAASALLIFREIHIITLVFGTTLIGTCIDYSIHYYIQWKGNEYLKSGNEIRRYVLKSLCLSFASTEICFVLFLFAPFIILKQFAVFSMAGLLSTFLTVLCIFPLFPVPSGARKLPFHKTRADSAFLGRVVKALVPLKSGILVILVLIFGAIIVINKNNIKIRNSLSSLYTMPDELQASEIKSAKILNPGSKGYYYIVSGKSPDEILRNEKILTSRLKEEIKKGNLGSFLSASDFIPPRNMQEESYSALACLLPLAEEQYYNLGFPAEYAGEYKDEYARHKGKYLSPEDDFPAFLKDIISNLWIGESNGSYYSCVMPLNPGSEAILKSIANEYDFIFFINKTVDISLELDKLCETMFKLFLIAFIVIALLLFIFYPLKDLIQICLVPLFMFSSVIALFSARAVPLGFFSVTALVMLFGLGMDYIIYIKGKKTGNSAGAEGQSFHSGMKLTRLGVFLSFVTTALSFGALALSSFAPVQIFGMTVFAGLLAAFITAMLLSLPSSPAKLKQGDSGGSSPS
jgi:predicted exporter